MAASLEDLRHCPGWPLMLSDAQAAQYLGLSKEGFRRAVAQGHYPQPVREPFGKRVLWHRVALDRAAAVLAGLAPPRPGAPAGRPAAAPANDPDTVVDETAGVPDEEWSNWSPS